MKQLAIVITSALLLISCAKKSEPVQASGNQSEAVQSEKTTDSTTRAIYISEKGDTVQALFDQTKENVTVTLSDKSVKVFPQAVSGSGARYADSTGEFWEHQGEATYSIHDSVIFIGKIAE